MSDVALGVAAAADSAMTLLVVTEMFATVDVDLSSG